MKFCWFEFAHRGIRTKWSLFTAVNFLLSTSSSLTWRGVLRKIKGDYLLVGDFIFPSSRVCWVVYCIGQWKTQNADYRLFSIYRVISVIECRPQTGFFRLIAVKVYSPVSLNITLVILNITLVSLFTDSFQWWKRWRDSVKKSVICIFTSDHHLPPVCILQSAVCVLHWPIVILMVGFLNKSFKSSSKLYCICKLSCSWNQETALERYRQENASLETTVKTKEEEVMLHKSLQWVLRQQCGLSNAAVFRRRCCQSSWLVRISGTSGICFLI